MKRKSRIGVGAIIVASAACLQGCAQNPVNRTLDGKLDKESVVKTTKDLKSKSLDAIEGAQFLTSDQRAKLLELRRSAILESDRLRQKSIQLQSILVQDLMSESSDPNELNQIKEKLKSNEQDRIALFFRSIHEVNTILGRWPSRRVRSNADFEEMTLDWLQFEFL